MGRRALVPFIVAFALICGGLSSRAAGQTSNEISAGSAALYYLNQARFGQDPTQQALVQFNAIENEARAHATRMARARAISFAGICDPSPSCTDGPDDSIERLWAIDSSLDGWCAVGLKVTVKKKTGYINKGVREDRVVAAIAIGFFLWLGPSVQHRRDRDRLDRQRRARQEEGPLLREPDRPRRLDPRLLHTVTPLSDRPR